MANTDAGVVPDSVTAARATVPNYPMNALVVTANDSDVYAAPVAVQVATAGDVACIPAGGQAEITYTVLNNGDFIPFLVTAIKSTNTTASGFIAIW